MRVKGWFSSCVLFAHHCICFHRLLALPSYIEKFIDVKFTKPECHSLGIFE